MDPNHPTADDERPGRPPEPVAAVINGDQAMFLDCPAYLDKDGALRCGLPAEVRYRFTMRSSDGPLEAAMIRCPSGHCFNGPIQSLTWEGKDNDHPGKDPATPAAAYRFREGVDNGGLGRAAESPAPRAGIIGHDTRLDGRGSNSIRHHPRAPEQDIRAPEHRSCLLSGAARPPLDHRHEPTPQARAAGRRPVSNRRGPTTESRPRRTA